ncbi:MAG TPA: hypothetical protein DER10_05700 [Elusimicrobia bacterium]|nr:hypothetical protein [Elusimicrobiota bacterium]HCE97972.1 hypothetical protein [Elusimicrobiota bacterium]
MTNTDPLGLVCGPSEGDWAIPDRDRGEFFDFTGSCQAHDNCYEKCDKSKWSCDKRFLHNMLDSCRVLFHNNKKCRDRAKLYFKEVIKWGGRSYKSAQKSNCVCKGQIKG